MEEMLLKDLKFIFHQFTPKRFPLLVSVLLIPMFGMRDKAQSLETVPTKTGSLGGSQLTIEQAVEEAVLNNLNLLAEQLNLTIAEARMITARLKPNPVFSFNSDHLVLAGTGFNEINGGGPPEISLRVDGA